jgi:hypothetical protein
VDTTGGQRTRIEAGGTRTRNPGLGDLTSDLDLEVKDEAQMDELGNATDESPAAHVYIIAGEVESDNGEETMVEDLEEEGSSGGRGTHNPRAPAYKSGARVVYLSQ